jgi:predicted phosphodiesterase
MKRPLNGLMSLVLMTVSCGPLSSLGLVSVPAEPSPVTANEVATVPSGVTVTPPAISSGEVLVESYDPFAEQRPLSQTSYLIPPTVQHVAETAAEILFQFESPQPASLIYRSVADDMSPVESLALDPDSERHFVRLEGLAPATTYQFVVRLGDGTLETLEDVPFQGSLWGAQTFRTPPYDEPVRFAVIGDSGFAEPVTFTLAQQIADFDPHFVLHVGDVVYRVDEYADPYAAFQAAYYAPFKPVLQRAPIYPVVGNHDLESATLLAGVPFYYWAFPPVNDPQFPPSTFEDQRNWYAFSVGDVQFVSLNTQTFFGEPGRGEQVAWFEERLADPRFDYSIVFFHVPPYSSAIHIEDGAAVSQLAEMIEAAGVPVVFAGHEHAYERLSAGSTTYFISGGGSGVVYAQEEVNPNSEVFISQSHYLQVEIVSVFIVVRAIAADGSVIDEVSLPTSP